MKYWILTTEYPPEYGGGIGTYVNFTARMLRNNGHEVTVFLYNTSLSDDNVSIKEGIRLIQFTPNKTGSEEYLGFNASLSYEYARIVSDYIEIEGQPDILESQEYNGIAYYTQQFKWLGYKNFEGLNILITCHAPSFLYLEYNHVPVYQFPNYWIGQMERASIRSADMLISPSKYLVNEVKQRMSWEGVSEQYIVNPVEVESNTEPQPYEKNYIVCFGKLSPLKGTFELLQYFSKLWDNGFQYPLYIIGGTDLFFHPEGMTMEAIVRKNYNTYLKNGLLKLEGILPQAKAKEKIMKAHLVLVPSIVDNLPYTVLEAMSWGKVVLASRQGGQSEVIQDGQNGFLFDHSIPGNFQEKLLQILGIGSEELKGIAAKAIRTIQENFSPEIVYPLKLKTIEALRSKKEKRSFPFINAAAIEQPGNSEPAELNGLLSIVIPYYNMGEYIEDCIRSVAESAYQHKEIIVVNDGSTESKSITVLNEMEKKYDIKVYHRANEGLSLTRNFGASKANGSYIAFLDADDTVEKSYYSKAVNVLKKYNNVHFAGCWVKYFGDSKGYWPAFNPEPPYLLVHNMVNSALVVKKASFLKYGQNEPSLIYGMEDWDSVINMVKNNCAGVVLPEVLFNYRVRKKSMARSFTRVKKLHLCRIIGERHKSFYNKYGNEIAQLLTANGSGLYFDNPTFETPATDIISSIGLSGRFKERLKRAVKKNKYTKKVAYNIYKHLKHR